MRSLPRLYRRTSFAASVRAFFGPREFQRETSRPGVGMLRSVLSAYQKRFHGLTVFGNIENPKGHRVEMILTANGPLRTD